MKKRDLFLAILLAIVFTLFTAAGCSKSNQGSVNQEKSESALPTESETTPESETPESETSESEENTEADKTDAAELETSAFAESGKQIAEREITDMAGRTMLVPKEITSVYTAGSTATIFLYTINPDLMLGWNYQLNDLEKSIILEPYHSLPVFGMGDAVNYEAIIAANPSIALNVGTINDKLISDCDDLANKLGIPVVAVDGNLTATADAYRFLGDLLNEEEQTEKLAAFADKTFADLAEMNIAEDEMVSIYFGNGENSLETAPAGSAHGRIFDLVKAKNVADLELGDGSRVQISGEQLLAWNPDVIVVNGEPNADKSGASAARDILQNPDYASLQAVQKLKVYGIPNAPFAWVDRPPGPNRIIGIRWLSGLLYPEQVNFQVDDQVKEFFSLYYHVDLSDEQLEKLYNGILVK